MRDTGSPLLFHHSSLGLLFRRTCRKASALIARGALPGAGAIPSPRVWSLRVAHHPSALRYVIGLGWARDARQIPNAVPTVGKPGLDRRAFLEKSGLAVGGLAAFSSMQLGSVRKAASFPGPEPGVESVIRKNVCTHCSVGCTVTAEVQNGVWTGQEPSWNSPINRGTHCCKGAAIRDIVTGERRLKYPTKLVGGEWQKISWDQAIDEIGDRLLAIRGKSGADAVYFLGSAKFTNEAAYLLRKFAAFGDQHRIPCPPSRSRRHARAGPRSPGCRCRTGSDHFAGQYEGEDLRHRYPAGADPIVLGESANTVTTYGYDPVTGMHEGKVTLCQIQAA